MCDIYIEGAICNVLILLQVKFTLINQSRRNIGRNTILFMLFSFSFAFTEVSMLGVRAMVRVKAIFEANPFIALAVAGPEARLDRSRWEQLTTAAAEAHSSCSATTVR